MQLFKQMFWFFRFFDFRFFEDDPGGGGEPDPTLTVDPPADPEPTDDPPADPPVDPHPEPPKEKKKSTPISVRVQEIAAKTAEMRQAERQAKAEADRLEELQKNFNQIKPPKEEDFDDVDEFNRKNAEYNDHIVNQRAQKIANEQIRRNHEAQTQQEVSRKWEIQKAAAMEADPAFLTHENKVERILQIYDRVAYAQPILQSEKAADIVTYFGKNEQHLERFASLPPDKVLKELGVLEYKLENEKTKPPTPPPEPITPNQGTGGAPKDLSKLSFADYEKEMNKRQFGY